MNFFVTFAEEVLTSSDGSTVDISESSDNFAGVCPSIVSVRVVGWLVVFKEKGESELSAQNSGITKKKKKKKRNAGDCWYLFQQIKTRLLLLLLLLLLPLLLIRLLVLGNP